MQKGFIFYDKSNRTNKSTSALIRVLRVLIAQYHLISLHTPAVIADDLWLKESLSLKMLVFVALMWHCDACYFQVDIRRPWTVNTLLSVVMIWSQPLVSWRHQIYQRIASFFKLIYLHVYYLLTKSCNTVIWFKKKIIQNWKSYYRISLEIQAVNLGYFVFSAYWMFRGWRLRRAIIDNCQ